MDSTNHDNTLNIAPLVPGRSTGWDVTPSQPAAQQQAIVDARQKIAELTRPANQSPIPHHLAATQAISQSQPVSPAEEQLRQLPTLPQMPAGVHYSKAKPILTALASFLLILALFKAPILYSQLRYVFGSHPSTTELSSNAASAVAESAPPQPLITIPKINVSAPVVYEPSIDETKIETDLESGVVHYGTTPAPGEPGNSVIVGHSSNDWWQPGNYKFVFVLLDKLVAGDTFSVNYNSKRYIYEVTQTKIVEATDLSVLAPTPEPTMTLITCWPAGTSLKREVIVAKQISPVPDASAMPVPTSTASAAGVLPGSAPSFWQQVQQFWQGVRDGISNKPATVTQPAQTQPAAQPKSSGSLPSGL